MKDMSMLTRLVHIAQVIGDGGVTLNLAQAEIEAAIGGRGDDILIGGGPEFRLHARRGWRRHHNRRALGCHQWRCRACIWS